MLEMAEARVKTAPLPPQNYSQALNVRNMVHHHGQQLHEIWHFLAHEYEDIRPDMPEKEGVEKITALNLEKLSDVSFKDTFVKHAKNARSKDSQINGTGKSMFISRLIEELENYEPGPSHESPFWFSPQVRLGYLDQHLVRIPENEAAFSFISGNFRLDRTQTTRELVNIGFPVNQQNMRIGDMSSGERVRLSLLVLKLSKPNFYVLDEPTNHLDIQGQEDLEDELDDQGHTCIFVSHDRKLVRGASTRFLEIRNGQLLDLESPEPFFERQKAQALGETDLANHTRETLGGSKKQKKGGVELGIK